MLRPIIRIYTTPNEYIDREMNDAEFAQHQVDQAVEEARIKAEAETKAAEEKKFNDAVAAAVAVVLAAQQTPVVEE